MLENLLLPAQGEAILFVLIRPGNWLDKAHLRYGGQSAYFLTLTELITNFN